MSNIELLLNSVSVAHRNRNKKLDVRYVGRHCEYVEKNDKTYQEYRAARNVIRKYPGVEKVLEYFKVI